MLFDNDNIQCKEHQIKLRSTSRRSPRRRVRFRVIYNRHVAVHLLYSVHVLGMGAELILTSGRVSYLHVPPDVEYFKVGAHWTAE